MTFITLAPIIAGLALAGYLFASAFRTPPRGWGVPALLCALFLGFTVVAVLREGPTGFWPVHTANLWGNQVWFDLLLAAGVAWTLILPRARAAGMVLPLWAGLVLVTGSVALLAMLARLFWLERRT